MFYSFKNVTCTLLRYRKRRYLQRVIANAVVIRRTRVGTILVQIDTGRFRGGSVKIEPRISGSTTPGILDLEIPGFQAMCSGGAAYIPPSVGKFFKCVVLRVLYFKEVYNSCTLLEVHSLKHVPQACAR